MARIAKKWKIEEFGLSYNFLCEIVERNNNDNRLSREMYRRIRGCTYKQAHCHRVLGNKELTVTMVRDVSFLGKLMYMYPEGLTSKQISALMNKGLRTTEKMLKNVQEVWQDVTAYGLGYTMTSRLKLPDYTPCTITEDEIPY